MPVLKDKGISRRTIVENWEKVKKEMRNIVSVPICIFAKINARL